MGVRYKNDTPSFMGRGAEIRLQPHKVSPKAHDSNGPCVNAQLTVAIKSLKRLAKVQLKRYILAVDSQTLTI